MESSINRNALRSAADTWFHNSVVTIFITVEIALTLQINDRIELILYNIADFFGVCSSNIDPHPHILHILYYCKYEFGDFNLWETKMYIDYI